MHLTQAPIQPPFVYFHVFFFVTMYWNTFDRNSRDVYEIETTPFQAQLNQTEEQFKTDELNFKKQNTEFGIHLF